MFLTMKTGFPSQTLENISPLYWPPIIYLFTLLYHRHQSTLLTGMGDHDFATSTHISVIVFLYLVFSVDMFQFFSFS